MNFFKKNRNDKIILILIILIALFGVKALFRSGFYTSHDGYHQIVRQAVFHKGLMEGQFPVRWAGKAYRGFGYPLFIFTYRLPFWIGELWYLSFGSLAGAIKFSFILSFVLSALTMYWFLKRLLKKIIPAFIGSILYLWAPYRFLDIFVRAALGEAWCFVFIPLVFLAIYEIYKSKKWIWVMILGLSLSGFLLSHVMTLALFGIFILVWSLIWLFKVKKKGVYSPQSGARSGQIKFNYLKKVLNNVVSGDRFAYTIKLGLGGVYGIALSAYYLIPAMLERKFISFNDSIGNYYRDHFVTLRQLIYSKWLYGFSMPGTENDHMSFQIGIAQWLVIAGVFIVIVILLLMKNNRMKKFFKKIKLEIDLKKQDKSILVFGFVMFGLTVPLMLADGEWFFELINKLVVIDIPWKFLAVEVFLAAMLTGILVKAIKNNLWKSVVIVSLVFVAYYGNRNHLKVNQYVKLDDKYYFETTDTSNQYNDYKPIELSRALEEETEELELVEGRAEMELISRDSSSFKFRAGVLSGLASLGGWRKT
jgi:hypothetical protein